MQLPLNKPQRTEGTENCNCRNKKLLFLSWCSVSSVLTVVCSSRSTAQVEASSAAVLSVLRGQTGRRSSTESRQTGQADGW